MPYPLEPVQAVADFLLFERLPFDGGLWEQSPELVREMRLVLSVVRTEHSRRIRDAQKTTSD